MSGGRVPSARPQGERVAGALGLRLRGRSGRAQPAPSLAGLGLPGVALPSVAGARGQCPRFPGAPRPECCVRASRPRGERGVAGSQPCGCRRNSRTTSREAARARREGCRVLSCQWERGPRARGGLPGPRATFREGPRSCGWIEPPSAQPRGPGEPGTSKGPPSAVTPGSWASPASGVAVSGRWQAEGPGEAVPGPLRAQTSAWGLGTAPPGERSPAGCRVPASGGGVPPGNP